MPMTNFVNQLLYASCDDGKLLSNHFYEDLADCQSTTSSTSLTSSASPSNSSTYSTEPDTAQGPQETPTANLIT
jgi:hypothetical protein